MRGHPTFGASTGEPWIQRVWEDVTQASKDSSPGTSSRLVKAGPFAAPPTLSLPTGDACSPADFRCSGPYGRTEFRSPGGKSWPALPCGSRFQGRPASPGALLWDVPRSQGARANLLGQLVTRPRGHNCDLSSLGGHPEGQLLVTGTERGARQPAFPSTTRAPQTLPPATPHVPPPTHRRSLKNTES